MYTEQKQYPQTSYRVGGTTPKQLEASYSEDNLDLDEGYN